MGLLQRQILNLITMSSQIRDLRTYLTVSQCGSDGNGRQKYVLHITRIERIRCDIECLRFDDFKDNINCYDFYRNGTRFCVVLPYKLRYCPNFVVLLVRLWSFMSCHTTRLHSSTLVTTYRFTSLYVHHPTQVQPHTTVPFQYLVLRSSPLEFSNWQKPNVPIIYRHSSHMNVPIPCSQL